MSSNTTLAMTPELEKAISEARSTEDIAALVQGAISKQSSETDAAAKIAADKAAADKAAADKALADKAAADKAAAESAKKTFSRTETINGREFTFEADSEVDLQNQIVNAYRVAQGLVAPAAVDGTVVETPEEAAARAAKEKADAEAHAAKVAELQLKMQRGEISMGDYIEQSGAIDEYLSARGIPLEALKKSVETVASKEYEQSWADATTKFLETTGADWPGGQKNMNLLGMELVTLGLTEAEDKVGAMTQAYRSLAQKSMLYPAETAAAVTPAVTPNPAPAAAVTPAANVPGKVYTEEEIQKLVADNVAKIIAAQTPAKVAPTASSLFGTSYGASAPAGGTPAADSTVKGLDIPSTASPADILSAWKQQNLKDGKDPNVAFIETFQARKV